MDILIILILILLNGVFAMSEIAVLSARKARLQQRVEEGHLSAAAALELANEPSHFLSTIQVGITSIGILNGAFGEAAIADRLHAHFLGIPLVAPYAHGLALTVMVLTITYLSVVLGELVPKRLALINPEGIAMLIAKPMQILANVALPLVRLLSVSSEMVIRMLRVRKKEEPPVTEEEINVLMEQGAEAGVFEEAEAELVSNILRLDAQRIGSIMTPHVDMVYLDLEDPIEENQRKIKDSPHSDFPVCKGGLDNIIGVLEAKDLLAKVIAGESMDMESIVHPPLYLPRSLSTAELLETFKNNSIHMGLVVDDYGNLMGLVTLNDILQAITGDTLQAVDVAGVAQRDDGSWLIDGMLTTEKFKELFELDELPGEDTDNFHTIAGFAMTQLGRVPKVADHFVWSEFRFEVVDMDRNRIDKILIIRTPAQEEERDG
ncbi:MAG TPA: hemolysin family protein [Burkholderiales bacterium]|nr:hemolysin family protein [Burkholderiales bacterium]